MGTERKIDMNTQTITKQITAEFTSKIGKPFIYRDFYDLASPNTVKVIIKRLHKNRQIERLLDGMYVVPYHNEILNKTVLPSTFDVAFALARKNNWSVYPSSNTALNLVGFSTQIPANYEFVCDGNYRKYHYLNTTIVFKRTSARKIKNHSENLATLIVALDELGKNNVDDNNFNTALNFARSKIMIQELDDDKISSLPRWTYEILTRIRRKMQND